VERARGYGDSRDGVGGGRRCFSLLRWVRVRKLQVWPTFASIPDTVGRGKEVEEKRVEGKGEGVLRISKHVC
jgi:hypothetical protein